MSYQLTGDRVETLLRECLSDTISGQDVSQIQGVTRTFAIDRTKLEAAKPEIAQMLLQMDDTFMIGMGKGGGWSFLNACVDRRGRQWTDLHARVELLVVLGIAAGMAEYTFDRGMWSILPGGVPYFSVREIEARRVAGNYQPKLPVDARL